MEHEFILFDKADGIATITLNRPKQMNALNHQTFDEILDALADAASDPEVRVLVLKGVGRAFSAGDDLKGMGKTSRRIGTDKLSIQLEGPPGMVKALRGFLKPVIAQLHGYALGGAFEVALAADLIIAADDARLGIPYVQRGVASGTYSLLMAAGYRKACEILFLGDWVSGKEAERIGLVNKAVPADELDDAVAEWAGRLAKGATTSIAYMKKSMNAFIDWDRGLTLQTLIEEPISGSEDAKEGIQSFIEKREPEFKGR